MWTWTAVGALVGMTAGGAVGFFVWLAWQFTFGR